MLAWGQMGDGGCLFLLLFFLVVLILCGYMIDIYVIKTASLLILLQKPAC